MRADARDDVRDEVCDEVCDGIRDGIRDELHVAARIAHRIGVHFAVRGDDAVARTISRPYPEGAADTGGHMIAGLSNPTGAEQRHQPASASASAALVALVNAIGRAVVVYDASGALILQSNELVSLLAVGAEYDTVLDVARRAARGHLDDCRSRTLDGEWVRGARSLIRVYGQGFWLQPVVAPAGTFADGPSIAVVVERTGDGAAVQLPVMASHFGLTTREDHVLQLLLARYTTSEIADALGVSPHTVRHHIEHLYRKTHVRGRTELQMLLAPRVTRHDGRAMRPPGTQR